MSDCYTLCCCFQVCSPIPQLTLVYSLTSPTQNLSYVQHFYASKLSLPVLSRFNFAWNIPSFCSSCPRGCLPYVCNSHFKVLNNYWHLGHLWKLLFIELIWLLIASRVFLFPHDLHGFLPYTDIVSYSCASVSLITADLQFHSSGWDDPVFSICGALVSSTVRARHFCFPAFPSASQRQGSLHKPVPGKWQPESPCWTLFQALVCWANPH